LDTLEAGHEANRAGRTQEARTHFLEAYRISGKVSTAISAANMLLKLFRVEEAKAEYEALHLEGERTAGFLSPSASKMVHKQLDAATSLQQLMSAGLLNSPQAPLADDDADSAAESALNGNTQSLDELLASGSSPEKPAKGPSLDARLSMAKNAPVQAKEEDEWWGWLSPLLEGLMPMCAKPRDKAPLDPDPPESQWS